MSASMAKHIEYLAGVSVYLNCLLIEMEFNDEKNDEAISRIRHAA